jgi:hypothetical protein
MFWVDAGLAGLRVKTPPPFLPKFRLLCLLFCSGLAWNFSAEGQESEAASRNTVSREPVVVAGLDAVSLIGMSVSELIENFGSPGAVYASRGIETWQDDVVFEYPGVDFYIYRDRVWQLGLETGYGISMGDPRAAVLLVLGEEARDNEKYILGRLRDTSWPLEWRFNIENGKVSAIYLYRMDY